MDQFERMPWGKLQQHMRSTWRQGEHVMINGPTGAGKTTLLGDILPTRTYTVMFVTKVHDDTITQNFRSFDVIRKWPPKASQNRVLLWPKPEKTIRGTQKKQREIFEEAINRIFLERNWCCVFDEQHYVCKDLGLERENTMLQHQGRSSGLSVVNGAQRPKWIPLITLSGSTHYFLWDTTFKDDRTRYADIGGIDARELDRTLQTLPDRHDFVYVNPRNGTRAISNTKG